MFFAKKWGISIKKESESHINQGLEIPRDYREKREGIMTIKPIVQIKNLKKNIGKKTIIKGISFNVYPGEVFGFLGPNGAGKTTTIRMLLGLISMTEGEILINDLSIKNNFEEAISCVGGIVENPDMYKYLTGYQNLVHYARMYPNIKKERIQEVVKLVGLENRIKDKVKTYSLGMRQRLGVAQALLNSPSLIVLDEPTNGLDPAGIHELRTQLRTLAREENLAVFVSSHLLSEMELMCDRVAIIQNGSLVDIKTMNDLLDNTNEISVITLTVDLIDKAIIHIQALGSDYNPVINEKNIEITADTESIPDIIAELVKNNIRIYDVHKTTKSLEDRFLEMTGGNEIA
jgi:ABC-2 type transport system ATP-binding protein